MKFKAYIHYTFAQSKEAKSFGDEKISGSEIIFTFKDIVGFYGNVGHHNIFFPPLFTARELIIPWLQKGNIPELIMEKENES